MRSLNWIGVAFVTLVASGAALSGCTEPKGEIAGCSSDDQCKGVRVCSPQGECVSPLALEDAGTDSGTNPGEDAGTSDAYTADASRPDADLPPEDAGEDTSTGDCNNALTAVATIESGGNSSPNAITIEPGANVTLDANASTGDISRYEWSFIDFPYASNLRHLKPNLNASGRGASFVASTLGTYVMELTVFDSANMPGCDTARVEATVATDAEIYVELVWDTPGDTDQLDGDGADMDLHYKHPDGEWGYEPLDIFWYNPTADWGIERNPRDDPELIRDDEDGAGPESIAHPQAERLKYAVGVYYYDDYGFGPSDATVRVYIDGALAHEVAGERLEGADMFYEAVTIDAATGSVSVDDKHYDGYPPTN
ncbi:PKD domain-containing protein [Persicimonas caeni]|nr:PKD domain-containing protein [Persicimonas caeni]